MKSIQFTELTSNEQEALQGGVNLGGGEGGSILPPPLNSLDLTTVTGLVSSLPAKG